MSFKVEHTHLEDKKHTVADTNVNNYYCFAHNEIRQYWVFTQMGIS